MLVSYDHMGSWSPTLEGFRTVFRRPALALAEVIWRWSFGAVAWVLLGLGFVEYLDTLPVSNTDVLLLRTRHPLLISQAFTHILHGSALRFVLAGVVLFSALAVLWIFLAALGRGATLAPMLDCLRERARSIQRETGGAAARSAISATDPDNLSSPSYGRSLAGLNFLRASLALAACAGLIGALILAGFASSKAHPHPGTVFFLASLIALVVWLLWSSVSWFLSIASIFVVRQGEDTFGALSAAVDLCRERFGPVLAVGTWFGVTHLVLFVVATSVVSFPLAFAQAVPLGIVFSAVLLLMLAYFAIVDTLYIGRLAGYVAILEAPLAPPTTAASPLPPVEPTEDLSGSGVAAGPVSARVDQDESILSDNSPLLAAKPPQSLPLLQSGTGRVDQDEGILSDTTTTERNPTSGDEADTSKG
jgi:hypothetical protein